MVIIELKWFPETIIPFIEVNLIAKTTSGGNIGEPNSEYVKKFDTLLLDNSKWYYSYIIKKEKETDGEYAQLYKLESDNKIAKIKQRRLNGFYDTLEEYQTALKKAEEDDYPPKYYIISYIYLEFKEGDDALPLEYKQLITINNPKFDEIRTNKS